MTYSLTWLPEVLEAAGLKVAETPGWRTRGRAEMGKVRGVMCHHTATRRGGNMPTLQLLIDGRPDLSGPLAQLGLGRDGTFYVVAAGRANHAGRGSWEGVATGNSSFIGIEAENSGAAKDPWPAVQVEAYQRGVAAILRQIGAGANMCCGHKEYALPKGRKIDPDLDMAGFRKTVSTYLSDRSAPALIPAQAADRRPTMRRGSRGALVEGLQRRLGIDPDGVFGAGTEASLRSAQREAGLVPDGIVGPKTWAFVTSTAPAARVAATPAARPAQTAAAVPAPFAPLSVLPVADDEGRPARYEGLHAVGPDGKRFASRWRGGLTSIGETGLKAWLDGLATPPASSRPSVLRVLKAMCVNEGGLEAINTYDGCHLSFGIFQWTAGLGDKPGELPHLLAALRSMDKAAFHDCFGRYGLDVAVSGATAEFLLRGVPLRTSRDKDVLRDVGWAYRFWRAGHHPSMRACQFDLAASRIDLFLNEPTGDRPVRDWLSSELGIALVLDEHVNRPGHVPGTLASAIAASGAAGTDASVWSKGDESRLIDAYLVARATTSMTDSQKRAAEITDFVRRGELSDARGSFR